MEFGACILSGVRRAPPCVLRGVSSDGSGGGGGILSELVFSEASILDVFRV